MNRWRPGDPVGMGEAYIPDPASREAYGAACSAAQIESAARHVIALPNVGQRRSFIERYPIQRRDALKAKVKKLWERRSE